MMSTSLTTVAALSVINLRRTRERNDAPLPSRRDFADLPNLLCENNLIGVACTRNSMEWTAQAARLVGANAHRSAARAEVLRRSRG